MFRWFKPRFIDAPYSRCGISFVPSGSWAVQKSPASHVVISLTRDKCALNISVNEFKNPQDDFSVTAALMEMVKIRLSNEGAMGGGGTIINQKIEYDKPIKWCEYYRSIANPAGHIYCKIFADSHRIATMYLITDAATIDDFHEKFRSMTESFQLMPVS